jgi:hypothetical protein
MAMGWEDPRLKGTQMLDFSISPMYIMNWRACSHTHAAHKLQTYPYLKTKPLSP